MGEEEIWQNMRLIGADFVLLERSWCFGASRLAFKFSATQNHGCFEGLNDVFGLNVSKFLKNLFKNVHKSAELAAVLTRFGSKKISY